MRDRYSRSCLLFLCVMTAGFGLMGCRSTKPIDNAPARVVPAGAIDPADPNLSNRDLERLEMKLDWRMTVAIGDTRHDMRHMFIDKDQCFVETLDAYLFSYSVRDGVQKWMVALKGPLFFSPIVAGRYVFAVARNRLYYIRKDGGGVDREEPPRAAVAVMASRGDNLVMGCADNRVTYFDTKKSERVWDLGITGAVLSEPLVMPERVAVVGWKAGIYAIGFDSGQVQWSFTPEDGVFTRGICGDGKRIYASATDSMLYALSPATGAVQWKYPAGSPASGDPFCMGGKLYLQLYGDGLVCFDPEKPGPPLWKQPRVKQFAAAGIKKMYAVLDNGNLAALDRSSGEILWERPLPGDAIVLRNVFSNVLIIGTRNGYIIALTELM